MANEPEFGPRSAVEEVVREEASRLIDTGFRTKLEARDELIELCEDDPELFGAVSPPSRDEVASIFEHVWSERLRIERDWRGLSDSDRLDSAFADLEASGVVARMNFSCCGTCGHGEIGGEVGEGESPKGYVFLHMQDADGLVDDDRPSLFFDYGAWTADGTAFPDQDSYEAAAVAVGRDVAAALTAAGLKVDWNGELNRRIAIVDLDWRRRLRT